MSAIERSVPDIGLIARLARREATVCVVGLGYVGLPLALASAEAGYDVCGIDLSEDRVKLVNNGVSYIEDINSADIGSMVSENRLRASTKFSAAREADVAIIAVPTPIDGSRVPDISYVRDASDGLASVMTKGSMVILESTTYPGTTEEIVGEAFAKQGLRPGIDVHLAYSPERIDPGNELWNLKNTPKVVAGLTEDCLAAALAFYGEFVDHLVPVRDLRTAEITKLFENTFRLVNIGLVNEFRGVCDQVGVDVWQVLDACASKPYGFMQFQPGPGIGGHCIPVDPAYLVWTANRVGASTEFIDVALRLNDEMPQRVVSQALDRLAADGLALSGAHVLLIGVAYKKNSSDVRESPAAGIIDGLIRAGGSVSYHDPHVLALEAGGQRLSSQELEPAMLARQDCVVIVADHDVVDWNLVHKYAPRIIDTRNVLGRQPKAGLTRPYR